MLTVVKKLTDTIPIVFTQVGDPLGSGFVTNYARPDGNITGFTDLNRPSPENGVEVLKEVAPHGQRRHGAGQPAIRSITKNFQHVSNRCADVQSKGNGRGGA